MTTLSSDIPACAEAIIESLVGRYRAQGAPFDDLEDMRQECRIAVWRAMQRFDRERGTDITYYLRAVVSRALKFHGRTHMRRQEHFPAAPEHTDPPWVQEVLDNLLASTMLNRIPRSGEARKLVALILLGFNIEQAAEVLNWTPRQIQVRLRTIREFASWVGIAPARLTATATEPEAFELVLG